jgi:hypothetical protein
LVTAILDDADILAQPGETERGGSMNCLVAETVYASFVHRRMAWDVAFAFANTGYAVAYVRGSYVPEPAVSNRSKEASLVDHLVGAGE